MTPLWLLVLLCSPLCQPESVESWGASPVPSERECQPYIEKALKERSPQEAVDTTGSEQVTTPTSSPDQEGSIEDTEENNTNESKEEQTDDDSQTEGGEESSETKEVTDTEEVGKEDKSEEDVQGDVSTENESSGEKNIIAATEETKPESSEEAEEGVESVATDQPSVEDESESVETSDKITQTKQTSIEEKEDDSTAESTETPDEATIEEKSEEAKSEEISTEDGKQVTESDEETTTGEKSDEEKQDQDKEESVEKIDTIAEAVLSSEDQGGEDSVEVPGGEVTDSAEITGSLEDAKSTEAVSKEDLKVSEEDTTENTTDEHADSKQDSLEELTETSDSSEQTKSQEKETEDLTSSEQTPDPTKESSLETAEDQSEEASGQTSTEENVEETEEGIATNETLVNEKDQDTVEGSESQEESSEVTEEQENAEGEETAQEAEPTIEDQLTLEFEAPAVRRPRDHITEILHLSPEAAESELMLAKTIESTLKELKKLYDAAIKPLEILFKYRDLSNRHFGDPEIFSKPLILFMGPWSGGKSTIVNYLLDNEFKSSSLRTGAEPSPAYFNILMWGEREEVLDGTQLAADWTFSGLQKFGQGLLDRLRGLKLNSPVLEKVNIVEIPGILEIRKQVERLFPFNDACQWFIDRADIIFLVYDPSKLDVGPETEAILDQLKGREYQTRIILNKADQVKPEELMRVQGTLIWNISPLMSSTEPPVMYSTSLWSLPYEQGAPSRLLHAQERAFLRDLRQAIDKRVENKIASARRFAVRVRNHAKMVDCYLTTYYNHKSFFGNKKKVADDIIEHPQNYHIYEGLSTLTNISRYDLPDPEVYRDFFRLNPLYDFQRLSDTCTYFRGCPINRLDVAIAYDLPELVGKYKKQAEKVLETISEKQATKS